jgi:hypothetical protein
MHRRGRATVFALATFGMVFAGATVDIRWFRSWAADLATVRLGERARPRAL